MDSKNIKFFYGKKLKLTNTLVYTLENLINSDYFWTS